MFRYALPIALCLLAGPALAQTELSPPARPEIAQPMSPDRLVTILRALDPEARPHAGGIELTLSDVPVQVFLDPAANRMRAVVPVASADGLTESDLLRLMQANFDTALDARYAIAQGRLWSVFIHPLAELQRPQLVSGLAQTVILAQTYGTAYASGSVSFGGGDSVELFRELLEELLDRGQEL